MHEYWCDWVIADGIQAHQISVMTVMPNKTKKALQTTHVLHGQSSQYRRWQQVPRSHLHKQPNMVWACLYNSWKGNRAFGFLRMNLKVRAVIYTTCLNPSWNMQPAPGTRNSRRTSTNLNKPNVGLLDSHSRSTLTEHPVAWEPCCETSAEKD